MKVNFFGLLPSIKAYHALDDIMMIGWSFSKHDFIIYFHEICHFRGNKLKHTILKWHKGVGFNRLGCGVGVWFGRFEISNNVNAATWWNGNASWKDLLLFGINSSSCHAAA